MPKINELLRFELAHLISRENPLNNGLITITRVKCSPNLREATILVSILPENMSGTALKALRSHNRHFNSELRKKLSLKMIPKFNWKIDSQERHALGIDQAIEDLHQENEGKKS